MSVQPVATGVTPWWPPATPPSRERPVSPAAGAARDRGGFGLPITAAALGGAGLMLAAAGFFLASGAGGAVLALAALAAAAGGAVLGACGVRRPLGEVAVIGIAACGLSLPLGVFDLLAALSGLLG